MKTMSIIGDSYSTYEGYVPEGYYCWYMVSGNECENDMPSVDCTWWKLLSTEENLDIVMNCSFSGSAVCYSGYPDMPDRIGSAFISRMKVDLGENRTTPEADVLFVFGGTNDFWAGAPVGECVYEDFDKADMKNFAPAFCYMLDYLIKHNPHSRIVGILNDEIPESGVREKMIEAFDHYGLQLVVLKGVAKENGHPNKLGMRQIADQVKEAVFS